MTLKINYKYWTTLEKHPVCCNVSAYIIFHGPKWEVKYKMQVHNALVILYLAIFSILFYSLLILISITSRVLLFRSKRRLFSEKKKNFSIFKQLIIFSNLQSHWRVRLVQGLDDAQTSVITYRRSNDLLSCCCHSSVWKLAASLRLGPDRFQFDSPTFPDSRQLNCS